MLADLTGKTALVTGAGSGIGEAIALRLAEQGASVAVTDQHLETAENTASRISGVSTLVIPLDVTDGASIDQAVERVVSEWGVLDILANNAGSFAPDWETVMAVNVIGVARCCDAVASHMKERAYGKIVTTASVAGHALMPRGGPYHASKAAVLRYMKGLARELGPHNINVNAVCPGPVWTGQRDAADADGTQLQAFNEMYEPDLVLGRTVPAEDIAKMVAFLASEDARDVTGQCIHVDGGMVIRD